MSSTSWAVHDFVIRTAGADVMDEPIFNALFEAGCDDALIGTDIRGDYLDFGRAAPTLDEAIASALIAAESRPGLSVVAVEPYGKVQEAANPAAQTA